MIHWIKKMVYAYQFKKAVKKANELHYLLGSKYYVLNMGSKLKVLPKQYIRRMIQQRKFKKGIKVQDIERMALYVTL